jgi:hypothetical protein
MNHWKIIQKISLIYLVLLAVAILCAIYISTTVEHGHKPESYIGCYAYDAMLIGYKCVGFSGSEIIEFLVNLPLNMIYALFFFFASSKALIMAIFTWLLPVLFVISTIKLKNKNT